MPFIAPADEIRFLLEHVSGFTALRNSDTFDATDNETVQAILSEAGALCDGALAPLQRIGDMEPARLENGVVRTSPGFAEAYKQIADGGWVGMIASPDYGGMGLPTALGMAVHEMMSGACLSLQLNPMLTQGQIVALQAHASDTLKDTYLPKLISGKWSGTMNLTEPQAGSDVGAVRTKAEPNGDGTYAITGQKIYITWGDSDVTENVIHLVLARLPDAAPGTKGISLFLVPKLLPKDDGTPGERNDLRVVSLEHKLGIHGSPTAVMEYSGAKGWLVGPENGGMAAMFTMMNDARLGVAMQGIGVAEAAFQHATAYAAERKQGATGGDTGTIIEHPDVRRMLAWMKARITAARAVSLACASAFDMAKATRDAAWEARGAFITPIAKAFGTQTGIAVSDLGVQVHGGMGFIEETGAAQFLRDVRITSIYEGTNGIQSMDLVGRKLRDGGEVAFALIDEMAQNAEAARTRFPDLSEKLWSASEDLREATEWMVSQPNPDDRFAGSLSYLMAFGLTLGAHYHLLAAATEASPGPRTALARTFILRQLPEHTALLAEATLGGDDLFAITPEALGVA
ncbi:MAG: acyl-CoA dehydrogenase [Pseudomonadota bacterium]